MKLNLPAEAVQTTTYTEAKATGVLAWATYEKHILRCVDDCLDGLEKQWLPRPRVHAKARSLREQEKLWAAEDEVWASVGQQLVLHVENSVLNFSNELSDRAAREIPPALVKHGFWKHFRDQTDIISRARCEMRRARLQLLLDIKRRP